MYEKDLVMDENIVDVAVRVQENEEVRRVVMVDSVLINHLQKNIRISINIDLNSLVLVIVNNI